MYDDVSFSQESGAESDELSHNPEFPPALEFNSESAWAWRFTNATTYNLSRPLQRTASTNVCRRSARTISCPRTKWSKSPRGHKRNFLRVCVSNETPARNRSLFVYYKKKTLTIRICTLVHLFAPCLRFAYKINNWQTCGGREGGVYHNRHRHRDFEISPKDIHYS